MMPLCTTDTPPDMCGCAFFSEGTPWVAQRVCAMPMSPARLCDRASFSKSATRPVERTRRSAACDAPAAGGPPPPERRMLCPRGLPVEDCAPGGVVAAILEPLQPLDENGNDIAF